MCALFGSSRDVSLFRHLNRELLWDVITQQCVFYQLKTAETKVNIYGEAAGARLYAEPVLLNVLIDRGDASQPVDDFGVSYDRPMTFKFLRDDLVDANVLPESGDIIMWYESYWEINNVNDNQLVVGKDPAYPYNTNPLNPGLENFGSNWSIICTAHYVPADKVQISKERI
jgi:hypothetical protein